MPLLTPRLIAYAVVVLAIIAGAFGAGWNWRNNSAVAEVSKLNAEHAQALQAMSDAATTAAVKAKREQTAMQQKVADLDARHTKELEDAKAEADSLRHDFRDGTRRVFVNATCPSPGGDRLPNAARAPGVADAVQVELSPEARQDFLDLREAIKRDQVVINGLRDYARSISGGSLPAEIESMLR